MTASFSFSEIAPQGGRPRGDQRSGREGCVTPAAGSGHTAPARGWCRKWPSAPPAAPRPRRRRNSITIAAMVSSARLRVLEYGALNTGIPKRRAASRPTWLVPTEKHPTAINPSGWPSSFRGSLPQERSCATRPIVGIVSLRDRQALEELGGGCSLAKPVSTLQFPGIRGNSSELSNSRGCRARPACDSTRVKGGTTAQHWPQLSGNCFLDCRVRLCISRLFGCSIRVRISWSSGPQLPCSARVGAHHRATMYAVSKEKAYLERNKTSPEPKTSGFPNGTLDLGSVIPNSPPYRCHQDRPQEAQASNQEGQDAVDQASVRRAR